MPVKDLQKSLPDGWIVDETLDGHYLFMSPRKSGIPNAWKHPDTSIDAKSYESPIHSVDPAYPRHVPPFEALSYCWGTGDNEDYIHVVDSVEKCRTPSLIPVRANLACAMRHLRYSDRQRTLWIDAISIDQTNIDERGRQVKRMSQIYPSSERVIIWIGPESEDSTHALETLTYFSEQVEYIVSHRWGDAPNAQKRSWWQDECALPYSERTWTAISSLLHRPWFERVWVLQEALSCKQVLLQCGSSSFPWSNIRKALLVLRQKTGMLPPDIRDRLFVYARGLMAPPVTSSEHLLFWTRHQQCTVPHDKIYGLLGLLDPKIVAKIEVDYSSPAWKTYSQLVLAEYEIYQKTNMLTHCTILKRYSDCPSWVPNWDRPVEGANTGYLSVRRFHASARSSAVAKLIEPGFRLQVTGRRIATISQVSHDLNGTFAEVIKDILAWAPRNPEQDTYVSGGLAIDALVEVLVRGRTSDRALGNNPCPSIKSLSELLKDFIAGTKSLAQVAFKFKDCFFVKESLFATKEGYMGVSAKGLCEGDKVSVILGCDIPMILRPTGPEIYEVVGPCFVHGLMLGEALKPPLEPPLRDVLPVERGWALPYLINTRTGELFKSDMRLGPVPPEWEEVTTLDPFLPPLVFRNRINGDISMNDPRMTAEAIKKREIILETFELT